MLEEASRGHTPSVLIGTVLSGNLRFTGYHPTRHGTYVLTRV